MSTDMVKQDIKWCDKKYFALLAVKRGQSNVKCWTGSLFRATRAHRMLLLLFSNTQWILWDHGICGWFAYLLSSFCRCSFYLL